MADSPSLRTLVRDRLVDALQPTPQTDGGNPITNAISGVGGGRDSGSAARPNTRRQYLTTAELEAAFRGTLYRRLCTLRPAGATRQGWRVRDSSSEADPLAAETRRLGIFAKTRRADVLGTAFAEARMFIAADDPDDLSEPLVPERCRGVHALHVFDAREFSPYRWSDDPLSPWFGQPDLLTLHPVRPGVATPSTPVHASRLLRFYGDELPPSSFDPRGHQADALGQVIWSALRDKSELSAAGARIAQEISVAVFTIANLGKKAGNETFLSRMAAINWSKSVANSILLAAGDKVERVSANPNGYGQLSVEAWEMLSAITGVPLTLLKGMAPGGLNTDGDSWQSAWRAELADRQADRYEEPLTFLYRCLFGRRAPSEWELVFNPLKEETADEIEDRRRKIAARDATYVRIGVLPASKVARDRFEKGWSDELTPLTPEELAAIEAKESVGRAPVAAPKPGEPKGEEPPAAGGDPDVDKDVALNGAQIASALNIVAQVALGQLPRSSGVEMLKTFFNLDPTIAEELMGEVGRTFHITPDAPLEGALDAFVTRLVGVDGLTVDGGGHGALVAGVTLRQREADRARHGAWVEARLDAARFVDAADGGLCLWLPLTGPALELWTVARLRVEREAGLVLEEVPEQPHVTLLYLGAVAPEQRQEVMDRARAVLRTWRPVELWLTGAHAFQEQEGRSPVVLSCGWGWDLEEMHLALLRALAHLVSVPQHPRYLPHTTIGWARGVTEMQRAALHTVEMPWMGEMAWMPLAELVSRDEVLESFALAGMEESTAA